MATAAARSMRTPMRGRPTTRMARTVRRSQRPAPRRLRRRSRSSRCTLGRAPSSEPSPAIAGRAGPRTMTPSAEASLGRATLDSDGADRSAAGQERTEGFGREWFGKVETLPQARPQRLQLRKLVRLLDSFSHCLEVQGLAQLEDRTYERGLVRAGGHRRDEGAVDLELVDRESVEVGQG